VHPGEQYYIPFILSNPPLSNLTPLLFSVVICVPLPETPPQRAKDQPIHFIRTCLACFIHFFWLVFGGCTLFAFFPSWGFICIFFCLVCYFLGFSFFKYSFFLFGGFVLFFFFFCTLLFFFLFDFFFVCGASLMGFYLLNFILFLGQPCFEGYTPL